MDTVRLLLALDDRLSQARAQTNAVENMLETADGGEAHLLHVFDDNPEGASVTQVEAVWETRDRLEAAGLTVHLLESSGDPADEILRHADEHDIN